MVSIIFLLTWLTSTYFFTIWADNYFLIPIWLFISYFIGLFSIILFLFVNLPIMKFTKVTNRYKSYATRSTAYFMNHFILRLKLTVEGTENIPKDGLLTIYANHKSYADAFLIIATIKRPTTLTPKMGVYKLPIIREWLKYLGAFPIDRSSDRNTARSMVDAIKVVKEGVAMLIFPEGGIKDRNEEKMVAARAGAYRVAMKAGADILPISLQGTTNIKYRAPFRSTRIHMVIHPLIHYDDVKHLSTAVIA
ncbi:MAG: lysophospholipid acyltransferase family protein, partial [Bacillota bacterium]